MIKFNVVGLWLIIISLVLLLLQVNDIGASSQRKRGVEGDDANDHNHSDDNDDNDDSHVHTDYHYMNDEEDAVLEEITRVPLGKFPFIVAVERFELGEPTLCTGTIFTPKLVLTSTSCTGSTPRELDPTKYRVTAGINELNSTSIKDGQQRNVTNILVNDNSIPRIAILEMYPPLDYDDKISEKRISFERFLGWRSCSVIKWGTGNNKTSTKWVLLKIELQSYDGTTCLRKYANVVDTQDNHVICVIFKGHKRQVCRSGGSVLCCDNVITGFTLNHNEKRCYTANETTLYTDLGCFASWTRTFAPNTVYNPFSPEIENNNNVGIRKFPKSSSTSNIEAIVLLSLSSALALCIFA